MDEIKIHCKFDEMINPNKLKNHPKNRNKHPQAQIDRLAELYKYHGIRHPIIVSKKTGFVVAGHGRKLAAIRAGLKEYPAVYQDFVSDESEYAFIQADNAIALWSELDFAGINADMGDLGPDFNLDMLGIQNFTLDPGEINRGDENSEWVDMPEFDPADPRFKIILVFETEEKRQVFSADHDLQVTRKMSKQWICEL